MSKETLQDQDEHSYEDEDHHAGPFPKSALLIQEPARFDWTAIH